MARSFDRCIAIAQLLIAKHGFRAEYAINEHNTQLVFSCTSGDVFTLVPPYDYGWKPHIWVRAESKLQNPPIARPERFFKLSTSDERIAAMIAGSWFNEVRTWTMRCNDKLAAIAEALDNAKADCANATRDTDFNFVFTPDRYDSNHTDIKLDARVDGQSLRLKHWASMDGERRFIIEYGVVSASTLNTLLKAMLDQRKGPLERVCDDDMGEDSGQDETQA